MENNLSPLNGLKKRRDFLDLKSRGRRVFPSQWLIVNFDTNRLSHTRLGWTIPRYVGPAVTRNRLKRWGREFFRKHRVDLGVDLESRVKLDINCVFKKKGADFYRRMTHAEFDQSLQNALQSLCKQKFFKQEFSK